MLWSAHATRPHGSSGPMAYERLLAQLRAGAPNLPVLARSLHMSERTLRRRLQSIGTRYQDLLDELRAQLAVEYVLHPDQTGKALAERLGILGYDDERARVKRMDDALDLRQLGIHARAQQNRALSAGKAAGCMQNRCAAPGDL